MLMVLPALASVHCAASGQLAQADPKVAICVPVPAGRIVVVTPAGQRTVRAATSTANWSLPKTPGRRRRRLHLAADLRSRRLQRLQQLPGAIGRVAVDRQRLELVKLTPGGTAVTVAPPSRVALAGWATPAAGSAAGRSSSCAAVRRTPRRAVHISAGRTRNTNGNRWPGANTTAAAARDSAHCVAASHVRHPGPAGVCRNSGTITRTAAACAATTTRVWRPGPPTRPRRRAKLRRSRRALRRPSAGRGRAVTRASVARRPAYRAIATTSPARPPRR